MRRSSGGGDDDDDDGGDGGIDGEDAERAKPQLRRICIKSNHVECTDELIPNLIRLGKVSSSLFEICCAAL